MSVVVAEEGNRRRGEMNTAEIAQSVLDIKTWFSRSKAGRHAIQEPATSTDIQRLEKAIDAQIPRSLVALLQECNGGLYFMEKKLYSTLEIMDKVSELEGSSNWKAGLIPLCGDDSTLLVIDTNRNDCVREYDVDEGLGTKVSESIVQYIEDYRNQLLTGRFEFLEDVGVVEKMG